MTEMDTRIIAVTHKEYDMPEYPGYINLMAGSTLHDDIPETFIRDDIGDNISGRNPWYCELTGLYWAWKNLECDNLGICHYRRYFSSPGERKAVLSAVESENLLKKYDIILPTARNYVIETNYSQYAHAHHASDLDLTRTVIEDKCREFLPYFDIRMGMNVGHRFNMFIMGKHLVDGYCEWLFDILFELEKRIDISEYNEMDKRVFGLIAERLLDVWIDAGDYKCTELPVIFIEKNHLAEKAIRLVIRKIRALYKR